MKPPKKKTITLALENALNFQLNAAEGFVAIKEKLDQLDHSENEGIFLAKETEQLIKLVEKMVELKGILEAAGLETYVRHALRLILRNYFGPKIISPTYAKPSHP